MQRISIALSVLISCVQYRNANKQQYTKYPTFNFPLLHFPLIDSHRSFFLM